MQKLQYNRKHVPRILGTYYDETASSYYRIVLPLRTMAQELGVPHGWGLVSRIDKADLSQYDIVLLSRVSLRDERLLDEAMAYLRRMGKIILLDYDDNFFCVPDHNPFQPGEQALENVRKAMRAADGVIVTNANLERTVKQYAKRTGILPNYVDPPSWPDTKIPREKLLIGLAGSNTHREDWRQVEAPMRAIMQKYGDQVDFMVAGPVPDYLEDIATIRPGWVPLRSYPLLINQVDIGLCPLIDDEFNRGGKTPIRALEFGMSGVAVVASPTVYREVVQGKGTLARTEAEWYRAIERYILSPQQRRAAGTALKQYVERRWHAGTHAWEIAAVYQDLYRRTLYAAGPIYATPVA